MSWTSRRTRRSCFPRRPWISRPSKLIFPLSARSRATTRRPTVVLPQPDSPTRPNTSPSRIEKETSETAFTVPTLRRMRPPFITGNSLTRWSTERSWGRFARSAARCLEDASTSAELHRHGAVLDVHGVEAGEPVRHVPVEAGVRGLYERWLLLSALVGGVLAARVEAAVRVRLGQVGRQ